MLDGILQLPWWGDLICVLLATHLTIVSVTLYLHRCQAHHAITLHPVVSHLFRFWLWFTTGQNTKEWVSVHRKHHACTEGENDPHSPYVYGIGKVLLEGAELYRLSALDPQVSKEYGHGTPDDLAERFYKRYSFTGMGICLIIYLTLFGPIGLTYWAIQLAWIPFFAAGLVNGAGHYWGYRNFEPQDGSTNLVNLGIIIGGEELHNNHHAYPSSARFSVHWWEFDIGWMYIRLLSAIGLAEVKKVAPRPKQQPVLQPKKELLDLESVRAMLTSKLHVMADYAKHVTLPVLKAEIGQADGSYRTTLKRVQKAIIRERSIMTGTQVHHLNQILHDNLQLKTVYDYQQKLTEVWTRKYKDNKEMLRAVAEWCQEAEATGIRVLEEFARSLRNYSLQPIYNHA
jgi:stearoyl-CoA desaturase (delta-9 desaturase)